MNSVLSLIACLLLTTNPSTVIQPVVATEDMATIALTARADQDTNYQLQNLSRKAPKLNRTVLSLALRAYNKAREQGGVKKSVLTVIDYSLPSNQRRMWVFDLQKDNLLFKTYVAHGKNSGNTRARSFSNVYNSKESSLGTYITKDTYMGHKGYSLNLQGLDRGFNDNAFTRRVVVHGAWYVEPSFIKKQGRAGVSWGCPAIADTLAKPVINTIKNGSVVFAYYPDSKFLSKSKFLAA